MVAIVVVYFEYERAFNVCICKFYNKTAQAVDYFGTQMAENNDLLIVKFGHGLMNHTCLISYGTEIHYTKTFYMVCLDA